MKTTAPVSEIEYDRRKLGLNQEQLAAEAGLSQTRVSLVERGKAPAAAVQAVTTALERLRRKAASR